jgi:hypothetical protein
VSLGSGLETPLAELRAILDRDSGVVPTAGADPVVRRLTIETVPTGGGAKFLRP